MPQHILVTGGTYGIGRGIAEDLAKDHRVTVFWHRTEPVDLPNGVGARQVDLRDFEASAEAVRDVARDGLHGIVNNAGALAQSAVDGFEPAPVQGMFDLNVIAPAVLLAAALPHMERGAAVVNISSVNADLPPMGAALYGASKAALNVWTRGAAKELGPRGIRVNAVAPGAVNVPEAPRSEELTAKFADLKALGRVGAPDDIAGVVRFLLSDAARFITGEVIRVSGGYRL
ncbi:MAG: SDR family oxidoreductase [Pseudomonadota bacterium]